MGVYYMWVCPARKEKFDPGNIPNGGSGGYGIKHGSIPYSAWGVAVLALDRWIHHDIRLISDAGPGLYDEADEEYTDVGLEMLQSGLEMDIIPEEALRFLAVESGLMTESASEEASRERLKVVLLKKFGKNTLGGISKQ